MIPQVKHFTLNKPKEARTGVVSRYGNILKITPSKVLIIRNKLRIFVTAKILHGFNNLYPL